MTERLTCRVTVEVKDGIAELALTLSKRKGGLSKACRELIALAFEDPGAPGEVLRLFEGDETESCTLDASPEESSRLDQYQTIHRYMERRKAFKSALLRGYALHLARIP